jgi:hypothetical protein
MLEMESVELIPDWRMVQNPLWLSVASMLSQNQTFRRLSPSQGTILMIKSLRNVRFNSTLTRMIA